MPTDIEKATAVINSGIRSRNVSESVAWYNDNYAADLAQVHRGLYKLDDATATTIAWLVSVGATFDDPEASFVFGAADALTLLFETDEGVTTVSVIDTDAVATVLGEFNTRGAVRRLVAPLGIVLTGVSA